jgi:hypothetical protein
MSWAILKRFLLEKVKMGLANAPAAALILAVGLS